MPMPRLSDELCREALDLYNHHHSYKEVAQKLGVADTTAKKRVDQARMRGMHLPGGVQSALQSTGLDGVTAKHGWRRIENEEGGFDSIFWKNDQGTEDEMRDYVEIVKEAMGEVPESKPTKAPRTKSDLLTRYLIADLHMGMHAWSEQCGQDYDLKIAAGRLNESVDQLTASTPDSDTGLILNLGDMFHTNDQKNMTPRSGHILDVDGRFPKIAIETTRAVIRCIETCKRKHKKVIYVGIPGNHDPDQAHWLTIALMMRYENDPRVDVKWNPSEFFVMEWGTTMLAAHHGDKAKFERLAPFVAETNAPVFGRTEWRYIDTGHIHHDSVKEVAGFRCESHRTLASKDAYAFGGGYTSKQTMVAITVNKTHGEIARSTVGINYPTGKN